MNTRSHSGPRWLDEQLAVVPLAIGTHVAPVNAYVALDAEALTIVDTGLAPGAIDIWRAALAALGLGLEQVRAIVVTHFHPDHVGAAGPLAQATGAPVIVSSVTASQAPNVWGEGAPRMFGLIDEHLLAHGMPAERVAQLADEVARAQAAVRLPDRFEIVDDADELRFAGSSWRVVATPGHADGHVCLYDESGRRLLSGDHLLERISPAVGLFPEASDDPLGAYLASLRLVGELDAQLVLPGHGVPFAGASTRAAALVAHHEQRLEECMAALDAGARTAYEVGIHVFERQPEATGERFVVTESAAHLEYERARGALERERDVRGRWLYRRVA